jgi:hypothetical protein
MVWNVRLGSTTTVSAPGAPPWNATVPWSLIFKDPSGVVIQTWTAGLLTEGAA